MEGEHLSPVLGSGLGSDEAPEPQHAVVLKGLGIKQLPNYYALILQ